MRTLKLSMIGTLAVSAVACTAISDFDSWAEHDLQPTEHVAVFAPADSHADAQRLENRYCEQVFAVNPRVNCEPLTAKFPVGQEITELRLQSALDETSATHLVSINLLESTPRTSTSGTIIGNFVWGHNNHYENNLHQVQALDLNTQQIAYSAQLRSSNQGTLTQYNYLNDVTYRIVKSQRESGLIAAN